MTIVAKLLKKLIIMVSLIYLTGCSTLLTIEGQKVRPVTAIEKEKYFCKFIGIVTGSHNNGWDAGENQKSAMNEVRNEAAILGGNAFIVLSSSSGGYMDSTSSFNAEVLNCKFEN